VIGVEDADLGSRQGTQRLAHVGADLYLAPPVLAGLGEAAPDPEKTRTRREHGSRSVAQLEVQSAPQGDDEVRLADGSSPDRWHVSRVVGRHEALALRAVQEETLDLVQEPGQPGPP